MAKEYKQSSRNREAYEALVPEAGCVPPQAVELEEAVLGALMLENDSVSTVQEYLTEPAFYTEEHRLIYRSIEELSQARKPVDLYTVTERLRSKNELTKVGGAAYLAQLTQKVGSAANVEFHSRIIAQKYVQRELIRSAVEIQKRSYDNATDVTDLIGFAESEILKITEGHVKRSVQSASDILRRTILQIEEAGKNDSKIQRRMFGFHGSGQCNARLAALRPRHHRRTPVDGKNGFRAVDGSQHGCQLRYAGRFLLARNVVHAVDDAAYRG